MMKTTTKPTDDAGGALEAGAAAGGTKAVRGATKVKLGKTPASTTKARRKPAASDTEAKTERKPGPNTKQARLIAMLQAKDGATVEEIAAAFGWQPHTVRGALYGALRKKLGLDVQSEKVEGKGRVYRIGS